MRLYLTALPDGLFYLSFFKICLRAHKTVPDPDPDSNPDPDPDPDSDPDSDSDSDSDPDL